MLKLVIGRAHKLFEIAEPPPRTHKLADLWAVAEPLLDDITPDAGDTFDIVRVCVGTLRPT